MFAAGTDDEVGVRLTTGVEVLADHLRRQLRREVLHRAAGCFVLHDDRAHRIHDLVASAVSDGEIHVQTLVVLRVLLGVIQHTREFAREDVGATHVLHTPARLLRERLRELGDDLDEIFDLFRIAFAKIVAGEQVQRDHAHPDLIAPSQELPHLRGARAMSVGGGVEAELPRPAPVAIDHHCDVVGHGCRIELPPEPVAVEPVQRPSALARACVHMPTLPRGHSAPV